MTGIEGGAQPSRAAQYATNASSGLDSESDVGGLAAVAKGDRRPLMAAEGGSGAATPAAAAVAARPQ